MQSVCSAVLFLCVCLVAPLGVVCLSTGAPPAACLNGITPDRAAHGADPQPANINPYLLDISSLPVDSQTMMHTYEPNTTYRLYLCGRDRNARMNFRGFMVQGTQMADETTPIGSFMVPQATQNNVQTRDCRNSPDSAVTHTNNNDKDTITLYWRSPTDDAGPIFFQWAAVQVRVTYWSGLRAQNYTPDRCSAEKVATYGTVMILLLVISLVM